MHRIARSILTSLALLAAARDAQAQPTLATLMPGDTLRVWAVGPRLNGTTGILSRFRSDTLVLGNLPRIDAVASTLADVPVRSMSRIDLRRGTHRSATRIIAGTLIGAGAGFLLGAAVGPSLECGTCNDGGDFAGLAGFIVGSAGGILIGGTAGGFIGARRQPHWISVRLNR